jgi:hypothetical protein
MKYFLASNATDFWQNTGRLTSIIGFTNLTAGSEKLALRTSLTLTIRFREKRLRTNIIINAFYFFYFS